MIKLYLYTLSLVLFVAIFNLNGMQKQDNHSDISCLAIIGEPKKHLVDAQDISGNTPLMLSVKLMKEEKIVTEIASSYNPLNFESINLLLKADANVNVQNNNNETALTIAARIGTSRVIELLVEWGADINHVNKHNQTALDITLAQLSSENIPESKRIQYQRAAHFLRTVAHIDQKINNNMDPKNILKLYPDLLYLIEKRIQFFLNKNTQ